MENERTRGNDIGPTGKTVAANLSRLRKSQQVSLQDLEGRLKRLGRRISLSALSKIERAERRVDVDDLMAIAIALDTSPLGLLLPLDEPSTLAEVTGAHGSVGLFWTWAMAEGTPFTRDERAFVARSIPWWLDSAPSITWHGDIELVMGSGDDDPRRVLDIHYAARTAAEADLPRTRD